MSHKIRKAVLPVAGFGTRFLPATKANAKEMMPVVDKPLIQYAVEEAVNAGINSIIFITGKNKRAIEDHFDSTPELERQLEESGKVEMLAEVRKILPAHVSCIYLRQARPLGLGHAISCAAPVIDNEPFAVLLADDLIAGNVANGTGNCIAELIKTYEEHACSVVAVEEVAPEDVEKYGILSGEPLNNDLWRVDSLVEKPKFQEARGNLSIIGRYVLRPGVLDQLRTLSNGVDNEIQLTDALVKEMEQGKLIAQLNHGKRYDCGTKLGYLEANVEMAISNPEIGATFRDYLRKLKF